MIPNLIIAEYSVKQDCFHVHDLKSMLQHNIENTVIKGGSDYLVIGVFETELEAHKYIEVVREQMKKQTGNWVDDLLKGIIE